MSLSRIHSKFETLQPSSMSSSSSSGSYPQVGSSSVYSTPGSASEDDALHPYAAAVMDPFLSNTTADMHTIPDEDMTSHVPRSSVLQHTVSTTSSTSFGYFFQPSRSSNRLLKFNVVNHPTFGTPTFGWESSIQPDDPLTNYDAIRLVSSGIQFRANGKAENMAGLFSGSTIRSNSFDTRREDPTKTTSLSSDADVAPIMDGIVAIYTPNGRMPFRQSSTDVTLNRGRVGYYKKFVTNINIGGAYDVVSPTIPSLLLGVFPTAETIFFNSRQAGVDYIPPLSGRTRVHVKIAVKHATTSASTRTCIMKVRYVNGAGADAVLLEQAEYVAPGSSANSNNFETTFEFDAAYPIDSITLSNIGDVAAVGAVTYGSATVIIENDSFFDMDNYPIELLVVKDPAFPMSFLLYGRSNYEAVPNTNLGRDLKVITRGDVSAHDMFSAIKFFAHSPHIKNIYKYSEYVALMGQDRFNREFSRGMIGSAGFFDTIKRGFKTMLRVAAPVARVLAPPVFGPLVSLGEQYGHSSFDEIGRATQVWTANGPVDSTVAIRPFIPRIPIENIPVHPVPQIVESVDSKLDRILLVCEEVLSTLKGPAIEIGNASSAPTELVIYLPDSCSPPLALMRKKVGNEHYALQFLPLLDGMSEPYVRCKTGGCAPIMLDGDKIRVYLPIPRGFMVTLGKNTMTFMHSSLPLFDETLVRESVTHGNASSFGVSKTTFEDIEPEEEEAKEAKLSISTVNKYVDHSLKDVSIPITAVLDQYNKAVKAPPSALMLMQTTPAILFGSFPLVKGSTVGHGIVVLSQVPISSYPFSLRGQIAVIAYGDSGVDGIRTNSSFALEVNRQLAKAVTNSEIRPKYVTVIPLVPMSALDGNSYGLSMLSAFLGLSPALHVSGALGEASNGTRPKILPVGDLILKLTAERANPLIIPDSDELKDLKQSGQVIYVADLLRRQVPKNVRVMGIIVENESDLALVSLTAKRADEQLKTPLIADADSALQAARRKYDEVKDSLNSQQVTEYLTALNYNAEAMGSGPQRRVAALKNLNKLLIAMTDFQVSQKGRKTLAKTVTKPSDFASAVEAGVEKMKRAGLTPNDLLVYREVASGGAEISAIIEQAIGLSNDLSMNAALSSWGRLPRLASALNAAVDYTLSKRSGGKKKKKKVGTQALFGDVVDFEA